MSCAVLLLHSFERFKDHFPSDATGAARPFPIPRRQHREAPDLGQTRSSDAARGRPVIDDLLAKPWDVIVIGTGMGGGLAARRLAERGLSVLMLERGAAAHATLGPGEGYWATPLHSLDDGETYHDVLGSTVGGTSVNYAGSLERPDRHDLEDMPGRPHPTGGWAAGYESFRPHFEAVERIFHVCGEPDPLSAEPLSPLAPPPRMSPGDAALMASFQRRGLHPYRAHVGIRYLPGCAECIGRACPTRCKLDARTAGVEPALSTGRAALLDGCEVTALRATDGRVTHVAARRGGAALTIAARCVVLAAGGLASPRLLLESRSEAWPEGLANRSGLVGRNLMFHLSERLAVWPERRAPFGKPAKTISMRDFYFRDGMRLGLVQSMGLDATYGNVVAYLNDEFDRTTPRGMQPLRGALRVPAWAASRLLGSARIFVGILEDPPVPENRVVHDPDRPDRLAFRYRVTPELAGRRRVFRDAIRSSIRGQRAFFLNTKPEINVAHPCGTLRFGEDPRRSVLDPFCRAHGLSNLYVADSSFMPTSNGVNPSLTIAANALRVADRIAATLSAALEPAAATGGTR
jgi:choline dehydrogenase-like flavoprotein